MSKFDGYHSALSEPEFKGPPRGYWSRNGHVAATVDLMDGQGLPAMVKDCKAIYGEPPWRPGYEVFNRRAGVRTSMPWGEWVKRYGRLMAESGIPACAMVGKQGLRYIEPAKVQPVRLSAHNDFPVFLAMWNGIVVEAETTDEVAADLAQRYRRVADLCCGFGRSSRIIAANGGEFVALDFNPLCIGYIAAHGGKW